MTRGTYEARGLPAGEGNRVQGKWQARCERPPELVAPTRVDPAGVTGPTPDAARGKRWRQTSSGRFVPACVDELLVEQRILEQGTRLRSWGAVTAWASLRWQGAAFFEGVTFPEGELLPIPLVLGPANLAPDPRVAISKAQLAADERSLVEGVWVTSPARALLDEIRRHRQLRQAVVDIEMVLAAGILSSADWTDYLETRNGWTSIRVAREAAGLAGLGCRTPQEVRMALVWMLDAELPRPVCNRPVFDRTGRLIAIPDLFDPVAGCAGEYQGADHKDGQRHRDDVARDQRVRNAGIETFEVVGGDLGDRNLVVKRMLEAHRRSRFLPPERRAWTLEEPDWWSDWAARHGWA